MRYVQAMKARLCPVVLSLVGSLLLSTTAWPAEAAVASHVFVDVNDPAVAGIRRLGERTIDQVGTTLVLEVRRVLASATPAMAIGMLHLKDYKLPAVAPGKTAVIALRRTSLRVRNPANTPDAADRAALDLIKEQLEQGDPVAKVLVQRVVRPAQPPEWRVYRPLGAMKQCLECHGSTADLAAGVNDALKIFYPHDTAVDYKENDWRGVIRVSIVEPVASK